MTHLADLTQALVSSDPGRPRITWYVADGSPQDGERIELSGAVLANWTNKAANLLQDELGVEVGARVGLDLPAHWRTVYWALAAWSVGATVVPRGAPAEGFDVVVTDDPAHAPEGDELVVVTLAALARAASVPVPAGAVDEARELASQGDRFVPYDRADDDGAALTAPPRAFAGEVAAGGAPRRMVAVTPTLDTGEVLAQVVDVLLQDGSVVLVRTADEDQASSERVNAIGTQEKVDLLTR